MAWFSSRGPTKDGRVKPDIVLPGVNIIAARAKNTSMGNVIDEHHTSASGTSMATPHCAGVCALLLSGNPSLSPAQIKQKLMQTAKNLGFDPNSQGKGRVDAVSAFTGEAPPAPPPTPPTPDQPISKEFALFMAIVVVVIVVLVLVGILFP